MSEISHVPSPYEGKRLSVLDHLSISAFWFGGNVLWAALILVIVPYDMDRIGHGRAAVLSGQMLGISSVIALVLPLLIGPLSDRCRSKMGRRRPFIAIGTAATLIGILGVFLASQGLNYAAYFAAFLVVQFGNNVGNGAFPGVIPDLVPADQRGVASGYMGLMTQVGTAVGIVMAGIFVGGGNLPGAFAAIALGVLVPSLVTLLFMRENPLTLRIPMDWKRYLSSLFTPLVKSPDFRWVWITRAFVMFGFYSVLPILNYFLRDVIGVTNPSVGAAKVFVMVLIAATFTGLVGGHLSEKVGRKPIIYWANGIMAVTSLCFPWCRTMEQAVLVAVVFGLGYGAYISVDWALGTDVLPDKIHAGKDMAVWHIAMVLPQTIAAPIGGYVIAAFGATEESTKDGIVTHYHNSGFLAVFLIASVFLALGALFLRNVKGAR